MKATWYALALALPLAACGAERTPAVDGGAVVQLANQNLRRVAVELVQALTLAGGSELLPCADDTCDLVNEAEALAALLEQRVFTEANIESVDGREVILRLRPEVACGGDGSCAALLDAVPVRLHVAVDDRYDLDVEVVVAGLRPLSVSLHASSFEVQLDLAAARMLLEGLGAELPASEGRIAVGVARHGPGDFTASLSVLEPVAVADGEAGWSLAMAPALPAAALRVIEARGQLSLRLGLGSTSLQGPLEALLGGGAGRLALFLPGLGGEMIVGLADGRETLRLRGVELGGTATVELDGERLLAIRGEPFDLVSSPSAAGTTLQFDPGFELEVGFSFGPLADRLEVPAWMYDERLLVGLAGSHTPALRLREGEPLEVRAGTLRLGSLHGPSVVVGEGMCLAALEEAADHPFAAVAATACR